jgi:hypothetical protein
MDRVNTFGKMEILTLVNFKMACAMVQGIGNNNQLKTNIRVNITKIKETVKDFINGETEIFILGNSSKI